MQDVIFVLYHVYTKLYSLQKCLEEAYDLVANSFMYSNEWSKPQHQNKFGLDDK